MKQKYSNLGIIAYFLLGLLAVFSEGCSGEYSFQARVVDIEGKPLNGAMFYAEVYTYRHGAYDFVWGVTDSNGMVKDGQLLKLKWVDDSHISTVAFADSKIPEVRLDQEKLPIGDTVTLYLRDTSKALLPWAPKVGKLSFPFENQPKLAERLKAEGNTKLIEIFREAYRPLMESDISILPEEQVKIDFLKTLP